MTANNTNTANNVDNTRPSLSDLWTGLSIYKRGILVVMVPVLVQACLLVALWFLGSYSSSYSVQSIRIRERSEDLRDLIAAETYILTSADLALSKQCNLPSETAEKLTQAEALITKIKGDVNPAPELDSWMQEITSRTAALIYDIKHQGLLSFMQRSKAASAAELPRPLVIAFESRADQIEALLANLQTRESLAPAAEPPGAQASRHMWFLVAACATIINLLSLLLVAFIFNRDLVQRLFVLYENTQRFAAGQKLLPRLAGSDEIALMDRAFRSMATALVHSVHRDQMLFQSVGILLASIDHHGCIQEVNNAARKVLGYEPAELAGQYIQNLVPADDRKLAMEQLKAIRSGADKPFELPVMRKDGSLAHTLWSVKYVSGEQRIFCVVQDMTERFKAEQMRKQVLQMVSHDLRNPLSTIGVIYTLLETGLFIDLTPKLRDTLALAKAKLAIMLTLVNNLLDIEKIEAGMLQLETEDVPTHQIVSAALEQSREAIRSKEVQIYTIGSALTVYGDKYRLTQIVNNLLANAIKRSPPGAQVRVAAAKDGETVVFGISDQGPLLSPCAISQVFNRFSEPGSGEGVSEQGQSALGMAISKALVQLHSGQIWVKSSADETTFFFSIKAVSPS